MKRSVWTGKETVRYGTRHFPASTLARLDQVAGWLGRGATQEMVLAVAVEYGLSVIQQDVLLGTQKEAVEQFRREFETLFG